jgi:hypothetical protein
MGRLVSLVTVEEDPLLDANEWAINGRVRINVPFGEALTRVAALPAGSKRSLKDSYAIKRSLWPAFVLNLAALVCAAFYLTTCGTLHFCADIPAQEGHVYDVVLYFQQSTGMPAAIWFDRELESGGACPAFPTPADLQTGDFTECANGGAFEAGEAWGAAGGEWEER